MFEAAGIFSIGLSRADFEAGGEDAILFGERVGRGVRSALAKSCALLADLSAL